MLDAKGTTGSSSLTLSSKRSSSSAAGAINGEFAATRTASVMKPQAPRGCAGSGQDGVLGDGGRCKQLGRAVPADGSEIHSKDAPSRFPRLDRRLCLTGGHADGLASLTWKHPGDQTVPSS